MAIRGDFSKLGLLAANLRRLADVPMSAARIAAPKITDELQREFQNGMDPYGRPWAPLAASTLARGRTPPPLTDTGALGGGTRAVARQGGGIQLETGHNPVGAFHQRGTSRMPARPILPHGGMPKAWGEILKEAARGAIRKAMGR